MESPKVNSITPNRILITPKVIFVSFGVLFLFDKNPYYYIVTKLQCDTILETCETALH
jgi:hypothetical protein